MLCCIAVRQSGMQPHFSMVHKNCIWTHSEPKITSFGLIFAFTRLTMINLENHGSHLENGKKSRWLALIS